MRTKPNALDPSRRKFMMLAGAGVFGIVFTPLFDGCESNVIEPLTGGVDVPFITPSDVMYVQNGAAGSIPQWTQPTLDAATWRLSVDGLVASPGSFTLADLTTLGASGMVTFFKTQQCVLDAPLLSQITGLTGNALWTGFPLRMLLDHCGIDKTQTKRVRFYGAEGFTNNLLLTRIYGTLAADEFEPMLVTQMNGSPLSAEHGFPIRLVVPEMFGFKNVKWITRIEATSDNSVFGTYQDAGFFDDGTLAVNSRMTRPVNNVNVSPGAFQISGFAVAGASNVKTVEVSEDGGVWQAAEIVPLEEIAQTENIDLGAVEQLKRSMSYPFRGVWAKWRFQWTARAGAHTLSVRATDGVGNTQPTLDNNGTDGANGIAVINVTVG